MLTKFVRFTLLLLGICVLSAAPVFADQTHTFTFDFTSLSPGPLSTSETFTSGPLSLAVSGFNCVPQGGQISTLCEPPPSGIGDQFVPAQLFANTGPGPTKMGLGLAGGTNEITAILLGTSPFIQIDIGSIMLAGNMLPSNCPLVPTNSHCTFVSGVSISMNGLLSGDVNSYKITAGNAPGIISGTLTNNDASPVFNIPTSDLFAGCFVGTVAPAPCRLFNVQATVGSVLLADVEVTTTTRTPEPSSAGLLLIGLGALVVAGTLGKKLIA